MSNSAQEPRVWSVEIGGQATDLGIAPLGLTLTTAGEPEHIGWSRLRALTYPTRMTCLVALDDGENIEMLFGSGSAQRGFQDGLADTEEGRALTQGRGGRSGSSPDPDAADPREQGAEPRGRRARNYAMVDALGSKAPKWRRALSGERLANFSFMGTEDWEDFASLSFTAMQLETISDLDHRVEGLAQSLLRIEGHLVRIAQLLERSEAQTGDTPE